VTIIRISDKAAAQIDAIYAYTPATWGPKQAESYVGGLFEAFSGIEAGAVLSRPVPAEFGVDGYYFRYEKHVIYWKRLSNGDIGIVAVLHQRMHRIARLKDEFGG
jgi:toxin ParE1/3/4